jgi:hypothetical protein
MPQDLFGEGRRDGGGAAVDEIGNFRHVGNLVKAAPAQKGNLPAIPANGWK